MFLMANVLGSSPGTRYMHRHGQLQKLCMRILSASSTAYMNVIKSKHFSCKIGNFPKYMWISCMQSLC